ncbi:MAG: nucleoside-diphosphate sugar epimerase [Gammaproteobacteria bacterium]|nr:MAG: nucleoside-diphosphate sugar epimerase [Gammaproteobacteria bacterium]
MFETKLRTYVRTFFELPRSQKTTISICVDLIAISAGIIMTLLLRNDSFSSLLNVNLIVFVVISAALSILTFSIFGLYRTILRSISEHAIFLIFSCTLAASFIWSIIYSQIEPYDIRGTIILWAFLVIFIGIPRLLVRNVIKVINQKGSKNVIIYGAGQAGQQLASAIRLGFDYHHVAYIDNDIDLQGSLIGGQKVYSESMLESLVIKKNVERILLAMPSASRARRHQIIRSLEKLPVKIKSIAGMSDIVSGKVKIEEVYDIDIEEILGRDPVTPDNSLLMSHNTNKKVLITGAGGSIGSELSRQVLKLKPKLLILFDVSEFALYEISQELEKLKKTLSLESKIVQIVGSVQNRNLLNSVFKEYKIQTVYHAAAYKHVPIVENNIGQGFLNNVIGTWNVATAAEQFKVEKFTLISTDKAVRPTNFMGASKRMAELVLQGMVSANPNFKCGIVRFGNVLGSSGSVVPLFKEQIIAGGPVTVTHPEVIRYFMTIPEAAQLVIQAGAMGSRADVYVLDMGAPIKIADLAERMIRLSGLTVKNDESPEGDIEIEYTGLRQGEKLYEELLVGEDTSGTQHPRILSARERSHEWPVMKKALYRLHAYIDGNDIGGIFDLLHELDIDFNQQYPISDPFYKKPAEVESLAKVVHITSGTDS